ncbi:MAG: hypothetical protein ACTSO2_20330 [Promethearchaeota archaeon]
MANRILLYSDDTMEQRKNFIITTFIWGDPRSCRDFENSIGRLIEKNKDNLSHNFKGFHASEINKSNWHKFQPLLLQVLNKLLFYLDYQFLNMLIHIESRNKFNNNSKVIEKVLKEYLLDRNSYLGKIFKFIKNEDLIPLYKRSNKLYLYMFLRWKFGGPSTKFEYYPDSSGKILSYKDKKFFINMETGPILLPYFEIVTILFNNLAEKVNKSDSLNTFGWRKAPPGQKLIKFEPKKDEESFLIQTADIISNFFYNLIKYLIGYESDISKRKATLLLEMKIFDTILNNIKSNFILKGKIAHCINKDLRVTVHFDNNNLSQRKLIFL